MEKKRILAAVAAAALLAGCALPGGRRGSPGEVVSTEQSFEVLSEAEYILAVCDASGQTVREVLAPLDALAEAAVAEYGAPPDDGSLAYGVARIYGMVSFADTYADGTVVRSQCPATCLLGAEGMVFESAANAAAQVSLAKANGWSIGSSSCQGCLSETGVLVQYSATVEADGGAVRASISHGSIYDPAPVATPEQGAEAVPRP